mgnify:FL=1
MALTVKEALTKAIEQFEKEEGVEADHVVLILARTNPEDRSTTVHSFFIPAEGHAACILRVLHSACEDALIDLMEELGGHIHATKH